MVMLTPQHRESVSTGVRAAGPLWSKSVETMPYLYKKFWETGVAGGNNEDLEALGGAGLINPMFAISSAPSQNFAVHYGTDPLMGFHVADAFTSDKNDDLAQNAKRVVEVAKTQFGDWCSNLKMYLLKDQCVINLFCGDGLAFGRALQSQSLGPKDYIKPWSGEPLLLDGLCGNEVALRPFDVIDTSNLGDHVGLINMLSATAPLLRIATTSVLYTESLLTASEETSQSLSEMLCSDVATYSLLVGLAPMGLTTSITMDGVGAEAAMFTMFQAKGAPRQYRVRVPWKYSESFDVKASHCLEGHTRLPVKIEVRDLAAYLFDMYKAMFAQEDISNIMSRYQRVQDGHPAFAMPRYTRAAIAAFIRLVMARTETSWDEAMRAFTGMVESDRSLMIGSNSIQEFYLHLHLAGLFTSEALKAGPRQISNSLGLKLRSIAEDVGVLAQQDVPSIVYIALIVPRKNLGLFTMEKLERLGTPALHVAVSQKVTSRAYENNFASFHCFFGKVRHDASGETASVLEEDKTGWAGTRDLVVICPIPTFTLLLGPRDGIHVALRLATSPENAKNYASLLGLRLIIFEANLKDETRCFIMRSAPKLEPLVPESIRKQPISTEAHTASVKMDSNHRASHLLLNRTLTANSTDAKHFSAGVEVGTEHVSPAVISAKLGKSSTFLFTFPFPVQGTKPSVRIARKSLWIEMTVPISTVHNNDRFDSWTQLTYFPAQRPAFCSTIPRVNLAILPEIPFMMQGNNSWIRTFLGTTLSDREQALNTTQSATSGNARADLKQSLNHIFVTFAGANPHHKKRQIKTFDLAIDRNCNTIIFATAARHDLDLGSLVMEAYALPLTVSRVIELQSALGRRLKVEALQIAVSREEMILWKRMLPALAERCRTWSHKKTCEYSVRGAPLSTEEESSPLCSCGEGKISGAELAKLGHKEWAPFAKYVVRIAISPIFPIPYVESSMSRLREDTPGHTVGLRDAGTSAARLEDMLAGMGQRSASSAGTGKGCSQCGEMEALKACAGCGSAKYCSKECQKKAWKEHKKECKK